MASGGSNHTNLTWDCGVFFFLKEIPPDLVCDINSDGANVFIKFLLEKQKWPEVLLLLTRKVSGETPLGDGLVKDCSFSDLDLCTVLPQLSAWDRRRTQLLGRLIDLGGENAQTPRCRMLRCSALGGGSSRGHSGRSQGLSLDFGDSFKFRRLLFLLRIFSFGNSEACPWVLSCRDSTLLWITATSVVFSLSPSREGPRVRVGGVSLALLQPTAVPSS